MTQPATPNAPVNDPGGQAPAQPPTQQQQAPAQASGTPKPGPAAAPGSAPQQQPTTPASGTPKIEDLLASLDDDARGRVLGELKRARDDAAKYRGETQTAAQKAQAAEEQRNAVLKALGLKADGSEDVDPVKAVEEANEEAWAAKVSLAVFRQAQAAGANADRLLRDQLFYDQLDQHVTAQPGDAEFDGQVKAAIEAAMAADPVFKAQQIPSSSGGQLPPTPGEKTPRPTSIGAAVSKALGNT